MSPERKVLCELLKYKRFKQGILREMRSIADWSSHGEQIGYTEQVLEAALWEVDCCIDIFRKQFLPDKHWKRKLQKRVRERQLSREAASHLREQSDKDE